MMAREAVELARRHPLAFTIQYPPGRAYFRERYRAAHDPSAALDAPRLLLYVHVPFCEARCYYCNFAVDVRRDADLHARYVSHLVAQLERIDAALPSSTTIPGIDIGGGTPTSLTTSQLQRLLAALAPLRARAEVPHAVSVETTPRMAAEHPEKMAMLVQGGISRVSMGLQSTNDQTLASVNRAAQAALAERAAASLVRAGFRRINVDLVFGLPGQTLAEFRADLEAAAALPVDSITTYDCLYRGAGRALPRRTSDRPTPEDYGALYDLAYDLLTARGFHAPYGSLNFSRHPAETGTSPYFEGRLLDGLPYVGAGNYASSLVGDRWWFAPLGIASWERAAAADPFCADDVYRLPASERAAKQVLLALSFGLLDPVRLSSAVGLDFEPTYAEPLAWAEANDLLVRSADGCWRIRSGAFRYMPTLRALFYPPAALAWIRGQESSSPASLQLFRGG